MSAARATQSVRLGITYGYVFYLEDSEMRLRVEPKVRMPSKKEGQWRWQQGECAGPPAANLEVSAAGEAEGRSPQEPAAWLLGSDSRPLSTSLLADVFDHFLPIFLSEML